MKKAAVVLIGFVLLLVIPRSQAQTGGSTEKAVAALEQKWLEAQKASNPDLIAPYLSDKITLTDNDGKVSGKAEALADIKTTKYANAQYVDVKVTAFGSTAIATGIFRANVTDASGKSTDANERWTDTWVKMPDGKWQCVASHTSAVKT
jgi:uncharacterized protein (TIGR02246 family)